MSQDDPFPRADAADAAEQARPVVDDAPDDGDGGRPDGGASGGAPDEGPLGDVDAAEADALEQRLGAAEDDEDGYRA